MKFKLFTLFILLGLVVSACGGNVAPQLRLQPGQRNQPSARVAGRVVLIIPEEPAGLNRYLSDAALTYQVSDASVIGLTTPNEKGEYAPRLAADLPTLSDDHKTVTWKLRPNLKWSDGEPITSDDIKFTWEAVSNPG